MGREFVLERDVILERDVVLERDRSREPSFEREREGRHKNTHREMIEKVSGARRDLFGEQK